MFVITEHQVLSSYFAQDLAKKYKYEKSKNQRFHKGCLDTFSYYGKTVDLSTEKSQKALKQFTLHYQDIIDKYQKFYKATKSDKASAIEKGFPDPQKVFYSESEKKHKDLVFVQPEFHG